VVRDAKDRARDLPDDLLTLGAIAELLAKDAQDVADNTPSRELKEKIYRDIDGKKKKKYEIFF
jgi:hypothetical protein